MALQKNDRIAAIYDERSAQYDQSFHPRQAADFVNWAELKEGQQVLDLCCGTGLVALSAKKVVGPSGEVIGVDISEQMMNEGRRKAAALNLGVTFMYGDCSRLAREDFLPPDAGGFDLITCASGLVLLENPQNALELWANLLAPGGKLIADVPVEEAMLGGTVLEQVLKNANLPSGLLYSRDWISSVDSLKEVVLRAGLTPARVFETSDYLTDTFNVSEAWERFEKLLKYTNIGELRDAKLREQVKNEFEAQIKERADASGNVHSDIRFYVAIAVKEG